MSRLSQHFTRREFACKGEDCCGHSAPVNLQLVFALELLRAETEKPLVINSGFRCKTHNEVIGGAENSQHCLGTAVDIKTPMGYSDNQFFEICKALNLNGEFIFSAVGLYEGRIHLDIRITEKQITWGNK